MHSTRPADVRDKTRIRPPPDGAVRAGDRTCDRRLSADNGRDIAPDNNRPKPETRTNISRPNRAGTATIATARPKQVRRRPTHFGRKAKHRAFPGVGNPPRASLRGPPGARAPESAPGRGRIGPPNRPTIRTNSKGKRHTSPKQNPPQKRINCIWAKFGPPRNTKLTARPNRLIETTFINIFATHGEHGRSARINNTRNIGACARKPGRQFARNRGRPDSGPSADRPIAWPFQQNTNEDGAKPGHRARSGHRKTTA